MKTSAFEELSVTDAAINKITPALYEQMNAKHDIKTLVSVNGADIRFRTDGTNPTTAVGHLVADGASVEIKGYEHIKNLVMICASGTAEVSVSIFVGGYVNAGN